MHGLRGVLKVFSYTEPREAILDYQPWLLGETRDPVNIEAGQRHGKSLIVAIPGVDSPESARAWVGRKIRIERSRLPAAGEGSYYWTDLIGLEARTRQGISLGRVAKMMETGANDVMVIVGDRERLVPFVPGRYVLEVNMDEGWLEVDWDPEF